MLAEAGSPISPDGPSLRLFVRIDHVASLKLRRGEYRLIVHALPGLTFFDVVILHLHHARFCPFTTRAITPAAHNGLELVLAQVVGDLVVVDAVGTFNRVA